MNMIFIKHNLDLPPRMSLPQLPPDKFEMISDSNVVSLKPVGSLIMA